MAYELITAGGILDLPRLGEYETSMDEEELGLLELDLRLAVSPSISAELESQLQQAGVVDVRVTSASSMLKIYFRKGFPWLAVIAAIILGLIVLAILIIGWRLFKELPVGFQPIAGVAILLLIVLGGVILARRQLT